MPALYHDNHGVRPPRAMEDGYHLSADIADLAIEFLGGLAGGRLRDALLPPLRERARAGSPHHAPAESIRAL